MPNPMTWQAIRLNTSLSQAEMPRCMLSLYVRERLSTLPLRDANHTGCRFTFHTWAVEVQIVRASIFRRSSGA